MQDLARRLAPSAQMQPPLRTASYFGPERRRGVPPMAAWLGRALDEIDYGLLLLDGEAQLLHANRMALAELAEAHPVQLLGRELRARHGHDVAPLHEALLASTQRGLRRMLQVGTGDHQVSLAIVPLWGSAASGGGATLVMLGKRQVCETLTVQCYGRGHGLTAAETGVLEALCRGMPPREVAQARGVGIATIRTQIGTIRQKTGAESIRALLDAVARLPPMTSAVRSAMAPVTIGPWPASERPQTT